MILHAAKELLSALRPKVSRRMLRQRRGAAWSAAPAPSEIALAADRLEDRLLLSGYTVSNTNDSGAGSLRAAILSANGNPGADTITFTVSGTITLTSGALPTISGQVEIDGSSAPGYTSKPVVAVNFNGFDGLHFASSADGSALKTLGFVGASGNGVTIDGADNVLVSGNYIGVNLDGTTTTGNVGNGLKAISTSDVLIQGNVISGNVGNGISLYGATNSVVDDNLIGTDFTGLIDLGNLGNGIRITAGATQNRIGGTDQNLISGNKHNGILIDAGSTQNVIQGNTIGLSSSGTVLGNVRDGVHVENADGNLIGNDDPVSSISYYDSSNVSVPVNGWQGIRAAETPGQYLMVGTSGSSGLLFIGTMDGTGTAYTLQYPGSMDSSVYSAESLGNGVIRLVGTYRNSDYATAPVAVNGFIFEGTVAELGQAGHYRTVNYPGAKYNFIHSTMGGLLVGNYDSPPDHGQSGLPLGPGHAFLYDIATDTFLPDVVFPGSVSTTAYGIWSNGGTSYTIVGGYSLGAANNFDDQSQPIGSAYMVDYDTATGRYSNWASFDYPKGTDILTHFQGVSSVEKGVYTLSADSAEAGTGNPTTGSFVSVRRNTDGSFGQAAWVDLNYTGSDPTQSMTSNDSVYGNNVVGFVSGSGSDFSYQATINAGFQLANVISGNTGNGVALVNASENQIAMNYIGTDSTGTLNRGNGANGVLVSAGSSRNIIGGEATGGNDPTNNVFVRPPEGNLISANGGNGVLINTGSTDNRLSGNFIGTAASGNAALGNALDGVLIDGADNNSLVGCLFQQDPFVFYNVISGNGGNGLRVKDSNDTAIQANFFGMGANNATAVGNVLNGVVIEGSSARTTMGGPIPLGNVVAANVQNGVVVKDTASDFVTYNTFCGLAAFSDDPTFGNGADGMLITTTGGNILIRTCVITRNGDDGIEISGQATGVRVVGNIIGLNTNGTIPMGNHDNGVEVGGNAHDIVIGGPQPTFNVVPQNTISANHGSGVAIIGTAHNITVSNGFIGTDVFGQQARGNHVAGVLIDSGAYDNTIGSTDASLPTVISGNDGNGIELNGTHGNTVLGAWIGVDAKREAPLGNGGNGIEISNSNNNTIGTALASAGVPANIIANNTQNGVDVQSGSGNGILGNSIYTNGLLGINLDPGANTNEAAPVITSVKSIPQGIVISGSVSSTANSTLRLEFFANNSNGPSGKSFLGSAIVTTNGSGFATYTFVAAAPSEALFYTATATDAANNTSEFSVAGETFNIAGAWAAGNNLNSIVQDGNLLTFRDQNGVVTMGRFTSPSTVIRGQLTGKIDTTTADYGRIVWSDGTTWQRLWLEGQYFNPANNLLTSVSQNGMNLTFTNALGQTTTGTFLDTKHVSLVGWNQTATFINGALTMTNGTQWNKLDLSPNYTTSNGNMSVGIVQSGATGLVFVNRMGQSSRGHWINPTTVVATDWNSTGTVANGQIVWSGNSVVWNKNLLVQGASSGQGKTSIAATNDQIVLTNKAGGTSAATLINPTTLVALNWGNVSGSRVDDKIVWSNGTIWDNFDFNALNAVFADIHSFPFGGV